MTRANLIEAMALSDALFDGRVRERLSELGRSDRQRYLDRSEAALNAIGTVAAVVPGHDVTKTWSDLARAIVLMVRDGSADEAFELSESEACGNVECLLCLHIMGADLTTAPIAERVIEDDGA